MFHDHSAINAHRIPQSALSRCNPLSEEQRLKTIFRQNPRVRLDAGDCLIQEGDRADHLFELSSGLLRAVKLMSDGRRVIIGFIEPGQLIGVFNPDRFPYTIEAVVPSQFWRCQRRAFERDVEASPDLRPYLFKRLCAEMEAMQEKLVLMVSKNADERLANFLLDRFRSDGVECTTEAVVELPMNRQDVADYLGLSPETVSRGMTRLAMRGVLEPAGRQTIRILKPRALKRIAYGDDAIAGCA